MELTRHLTNLYLLVHVIDAGGFSAAARELGTTRSLISRHLIDLEKALGVRLLYRDARRFAVTPAGEAVYRQALTMCDAAHAAIAAAHESRSPGGRPLRIGQCDALSPLLSLQLTELGKFYPGLQLSTYYNNNVDALLRQHVDVILQLGHALPDSADIIARPLGHVRLVTIASPALLKKLGHPTHPKAVDTCYRLGYSGHGLTTDWRLRGHKANSLPARAFSNRADLVVRAAQAGMGMAQLPLCACHEALAQGQLQLVFEELEAEPLPLHALTVTGHAPSDTVQDFIQTLNERIKRLRLPYLTSTNARISA